MPETLLGLSETRVVMARWQVARRGIREVLFRVPRPISLSISDFSYTPALQNPLRGLSCHGLLRQTYSIQIVCY